MMPQRKTSATWLTNVKQKMPVDKVYIDNSQAKIENKNISCELESNVDQIQMRQHRSAADIKFQIRQARQEAERYRRMRSLQQRDHVNNAIMARRKERQSVQGVADRDATVASSQQSLQRKRALAFANRKSLSESSRLAESTTPVSKMVSGSPPTGSEAPKRDRQISADSFFLRRQWDSLENDSSDSDNDIFSNLPPSRKQARALREATARRNSTSDKVEERRPSQEARKRSRSKTSLGFVRQTSPNDLHVNCDTDTPQDCCAGRSYQELKQLTHIDKLAANQAALEKDQIMQLREKAKEQREKEMKEKISGFISDIRHLCVNADTCRDPRHGHQRSVSAQ